MSRPMLGIMASSITGGLSTTSYQSIATTTVGSGGTANIIFSSIPATYTHLQIRILVQTNRPTYSLDELPMTFNSDTAANYSYHYLVGGYGPTSAITFASNVINTTNMHGIGIPSGVAGANVFGTAIIDILDYANTNKYKTIKSLVGFDCNGTAGTGSYGGTVSLNSGNWRSTSAITSITFPISADATLFNQYSSFALYGIKGA